MSWVLVAMSPAIFWSLSSLFDEYISKKHNFLHGIHYLALQAAISILPGLLLLIIRPEALAIDPTAILALSILGVFFSLCFWPYIIAIKEDGAGLVIPIYQTLPLFIFLVAWLVLGETITWVQLIASVCVVIAATAAMVDNVKGFRLRSLKLMVLSCLMLAIYVTATRYYVGHFLLAGRDAVAICRGRLDCVALLFVCAVYTRRCPRELPWQRLSCTHGVI